MENVRHKPLGRVDSNSLTIGKPPSETPISPPNQVVDENFDFRISENTLPLITPGPPILPFKIHELKFTRHGTLIRPTRRLVRKPPSSNINLHNKARNSIRTLDRRVDNEMVDTSSTSEMRINSSNFDNIDSISSLNDYFDDLNFLKDDASFERQLSIGELSFYPNFNFGAEKSVVVEFPIESHSEQGAVVTGDEGLNQPSVSCEQDKQKEVGVKSDISVESLSSGSGAENSECGFQVVKKTSRSKVWLKYFREKVFEFYDHWRKKIGQVNDKTALTGLYTHENVNLESLNANNNENKINCLRRRATMKIPKRLLRFTAPEQELKVEEIVQQHELDPSAKELAENEEVVGALLFIKAHEEQNKEMQQLQQIKEVIDAVKPEEKDVEIKDDVVSSKSSISECKSFVNDYPESYVFIDVD
ncbi:hypothetical protein JA1_004891 [Spathaspora sp. JA1]|nr:hypothetical protein JA1_004891 [Spathaspora sp. JA1]